MKGGLFKPRRVRLQFQAPRRSNDYIRLRYYWLNELIWLRAKRRNGTATKNDIKVAQRALVKVRKDYG
jgi:hypothetical protein